MRQVVWSVIPLARILRCPGSPGKCGLPTVGCLRSIETHALCDLNPRTPHRRPWLAVLFTGLRRGLSLPVDRWRAKPVATSSDPVRTRTVLLFCILLSGCGLRSGAPRPSIEFTRVPPAAEGGRDKLDIIEGRVSGASPGQQIVLYAKSGTWWVQPLANEMFTTIQMDSKWINSTHLGTEYAALLVEPGYRPAATISALPMPGSGVAAVATAKGADSAISKTLSFSGYEWRIREAPSDRGGVNFFNASNAWTDADGALHLRIAKREGHWTCAEVILTRNLGYGTYSFVVRDTSHLEPPVVLSMFTWDYGGASQNHREMDIEVSQWGDPISKNAQYVVQPFFIPENASRFMLPGGVMTHSFRWEPGRVSFKTVREAAPGGRTRPVAEHVFTSGVPTPGMETLRMNLYVFAGAKNPPQNGTEVVVEKFEYLP
jgi:hypothetical protein